MKFKSIKYTKEFKTIMGTSEWIGAKINLDDKDNPVDVLNEAKFLVEKYHIDSNQQLYIDDVPSIYIPKEEVKDDFGSLALVASLINEINTCTKIKVLESYKFIVKSDPDLQDAYDKKLKELQP